MKTSKKKTKKTEEVEPAEDVYQSIIEGIIYKLNFKREYFFNIHIFSISSKKKKKTSMN